MNDTKNNLDRRLLLQLAGLGLGTVVLDACASSNKKDVDEVPGDNQMPMTDAGGKPQQTFRRSSTVEDDSPMNRSFGEVAPYRFTGDEPDRPHQILWDIPAFLASKGGQVPDPSEKAAVVVVGGGMSGLLSAYQLKKYLPIVLESADRIGGNSRGESWRGHDYSIGAAYLSAPEEGGALEQLMKEIEVASVLRPAPANKSVGFRGKIFHRFFAGETDPAVATQGALLEKYFTDVLHGKNGRVYPELPPKNEAEKKAVKELDKLSLREHLKKVLGTNTIHPHIDTWFEHYCWSTFGVSYRELSAAVGVNQIAAEFGKIVVAPGGNGFIAENLLKKLRKNVGAERVRSRSTVFQVKKMPEGVWVSYERDGEIKTILAEAVVMACPKFVVRRILTDLEPERERVIRRLRYNSYLVANVLLNHKLPRDFYDLYLLGDGKINGLDIQASAEKDRVTDVVNATYAKMDASSGILTLYRPIPYLGGRALIYSSGAYLKFRKDFIDQIEREILPTLGIPTTAMAGLRLSRWGHPMPVAQPGLLASGQAEILHKPIDKKIFFVNQDNWLNPCFETAFSEAQRWAPILVEGIEERRLQALKNNGTESSVETRKASSPAEGAPSSAPKK